MGIKQMNENWEPMDLPWVRNPPDLNTDQRKKYRMEIKEYENWTQVQIYYAKSYDPLP